MNIIFIAGLLAIGIIIGVLSVILINKHKENHAKQNAKEILEEAERNVKKLERDAYINAKEKFQKERFQLQKQLKHREAEISKNEDRIRRREKELRRQDDSLKERESTLRKQQKQIDQTQGRISEQEKKAREIVNQQIERLESLSGLNRDEAKKQLLEFVSHQSSKI
ncbi:DUF3552 domain-containing protein [Candidatus Saccharibacteria bacterium]|nr:DUF3552 domain-containing protein [Candidatus Saccharibacteria bacterium]NIV04045.1 DUF3552 domain-containing protein [Calditrichia bacterium]NIV72422.1 DUF3552 domain-containing protein [Calditrichia bacterium]NIV99499.1 DUF3552 domain-containing protein [Candidatus Saccharibacteria bacterium]NIW79791.1 DUF3552 domain-containing protein [Calditrichia bacterium]